MDASPTLPDEGWIDEIFLGDDSNLTGPSALGSSNAARFDWHSFKHRTFHIGRQSLIRGRKLGYR